MKINTSYLKAFIIDTRMMLERFCIVLDEKSRKTFNAILFQKLIYSLFTKKKLEFMLN